MVILCKFNEVLARSGKTAHEVADATGISEATLSEWRTDKITKFDRRTLQKLCQYFQCTPGDLIVYIPDNTLPPIQP